MQSEKAVVLLSGGPRSYASLLLAIKRFGAGCVDVIHATYGQKTENVDFAEAQRVSRLAGVAFRRVRMEAVGVLGQSSRLPGQSRPPGLHPVLSERLPPSKGKPDGALEKWLFPKGQPSRVPTDHFLPGLHMALVSLGAMEALRVGAGEIWTGMGWPLEGLEALQEAVRWSCQLPGLALVQPLQGKVPMYMFEVAQQLGQVTAMHNTVSCYAGNTNAWHAWGRGCGECGGCTARAAAWETYSATYNPPASPEEVAAAKALEEAAAAEETRAAKAKALAAQRIEPKAD